MKRYKIRLSNLSGSLDFPMALSVADSSSKERMSALNWATLQSLSRVEPHTRASASKSSVGFTRE